MRTVFIALALLVLTAGGFALTLGPFPGEALEDPVFYNELGYMLAQEGDLDGAQDAFLQAVLLDSSYENARKNLYVTAFQNGEYLLAAEHAGLLVEEHGNAQYHFDYGQALVLWARNDAAEGDAALGALETALIHLDAAGAYPHAAENAVIVRNVLAQI